MMKSNTVEIFQHAMREAGIEPPADIVADSGLHRFTVTGDRARSKNGWYLLHPDDPVAGAFGCWKRGISETWSNKAFQTMTTTEKTAYAAKMSAMKRQCEEEREKVHAKCRKESAGLWNRGHDVDEKHPYLVAKQFKPYGVRQLKESLMIPVRDASGKLLGLQFIGVDGAKKFKTGTTVTGCFFSIGIPCGKVLIVEGLATGSTLHEITGLAVAVAFDCGNLSHVAAVLRAKLPDTVLIICADDDHATEGNPGLTKATEAAQAVGGLLAIPAFPDNRRAKDTDFNDLARLAGQEAVRVCIEGAVIVPPSPCTDNLSEANQANDAIQLKSTVRRLAALSPLEYDRVRKTEATALGVRQATLDAEVKAARKGNDNGVLLFEEVEPWPERVDPARLLTDIAITIRRFIICSEEVSNAVALWIAMTWFIDVVQTAPMAVITAPEKRCGKSLLLYLLGQMSAKAITASSISPAALFRTIESWKPTILIDEVDACLKDNEELRGLLNSGHTRGSAYVIRTVGDNFTPTKFSTFGAKALAGIGHVADTLMDRSITLELRRKLPQEKVYRIRDSEPKLFNDLCSKLAKFAEDYSEEVRQARPPLPNTLNDREQDNWDPLLAIAMTASDQWLKLGITAALKLSGVESASQTIGTELLADIQSIFKEKNIDRISTGDLIDALCADNEKPWKTYSKGFPITPRQLANKLKAYGIHSKSIRIGNFTIKGYMKDWFTEAFSRYIPSPISASVTASQPAPAKDLQAFQNVTKAADVTVLNLWKPTPVKECDVVTVENMEKGHDQLNNLREVRI